MAKTIKADGLDRILAGLADGELKPGEFTARQVYDQQRANGGTKTLKAIRELLRKMDENGDLTSRKICWQGKQTNAYMPK